MAILSREYTARRDYLCETCRGEIPKGTRYVRLSATPNDPDIENTRWRSIRVHGQTPDDCPDFADVVGNGPPLGAHTSDDCPLLDETELGTRVADALATETKQRRTR